jgi:hypothetical protein
MMLFRLRHTHSNFRHTEQAISTWHERLRKESKGIGRLATGRSGSYKHAAQLQNILSYTIHI